MSEMPHEQSSPPLSDILRKVTADIEQGKPIREQLTQEVALTDPAPDALAVHQERITSQIGRAHV